MGVGGEVAEVWAGGEECAAGCVEAWRAWGASGGQGCVRVLGGGLVAGLGAAAFGFLKQSVRMLATVALPFAS